MISLQGDLLDLCVKEYPTHAAAMDAKAAFFGDNKAEIIRYIIADSLPKVGLVPPNAPPRPDAMRYGTIRLVRLPSGFWAWIPSEPDDIAYVSEFKVSRGVEFGVGRYLTTEGGFALRPGMDQEVEAARFRQYLMRIVTTKFSEQFMNPDKIYRIACHFDQSKDPWGMGVRVVATLVYCEEV